MTTEPALTSNEKALTISLLVVGGLVALMTVPVLGGAIYALATGKVMGADLSKAIVKAGPLSKDPRMGELMERQLQLQAETQARFAPYQLAVEGTYLALWAAMAWFAVCLLRGGGGRQRLGQLSLAAIVTRLAVGAVTWALTSELTRASAETMMSGLPSGNLSAEKAERMKTGVGAMMTGLTAVSAACMTFVICGYLVVVAVFFLRVRPAPPAAPAP